MSVLILYSIFPLSGGVLVCSPLYTTGSRIVLRGAQHDLLGMLLEALTISNLVILWGGKILPQSNPKRAYNTSFYFFRSSKLLQCVPLSLPFSFFPYTFWISSPSTKSEQISLFPKIILFLRGGNGPSHSNLISTFPGILHFPEGGGCLTSDISISKNSAFLHGWEEGPSSFIT